MAIFRSYLAGKLAVERFINLNFLLLPLNSYKNKMMPNKTYELRNLYFQQSQYSVEPVEPDKPLFLQWPSKGYFERLQPDADLLQKALNPETDCKNKTVSEQIFGNEIKQQYIGLKHMANLFYERCRLHNQHIEDIDHRHLEIQEKKFGAEINPTPENFKRLTNLEGQLLQLEQSRRDEELAFWKDTVELREKLFENSVDYRAAKHRESIFSDVEADYGR